MKEHDVLIAKLVDASTNAQPSNPESSEIVRQPKKLKSKEEIVRTQSKRISPSAEITKEEWTEVKATRASAPKEGAASDPAKTRATRTKVRPPAVLV